MPRLSLQPTITSQLASVVTAIRQADRDILGYAREAGELLLQVPPGQRAAAAREAGITGRRTRFVYVQVAQHWERVQHAASLRAALKIINVQRVRGHAIPLPFDSRCIVTQHAITGLCESDGPKVT